MTGLIVLVCRITIAVCAEIIHHFNPDPDEPEPYGPRIHWGLDTDYRMEP